jgi:uncharacterized coiled-coil protein SlyX
MTSMADEEQSTFSLIPGLVQGYIGQLRATTERLQDLGHLPSAAGIPTLPTLPGAFSAAQMATITDSIAAQRRSIEALQAQLSAYDEQLAVLEQALGPLSEWSKTWADFEQQVLKMGQKPGSGRLADAGPVN